MALALKMPSLAGPALLYCRPPGAFADQDEQVSMIRRQRRHQIDVLTCAPADARRRTGKWVSAVVPTILILRGGKMVGMAVGRLPRRELESLIEHALL